MLYLLTKRFNKVWIRSTRAEVVTLCKMTPKFHRMWVWYISAPDRQQSWYVSNLVNVCASTGCGSFTFYSVAPPMIQNPPQQIRKASSFAGWWSTMQQFSIEQIEPNRKSDTETTLKHPVIFKIKHSVLTQGHISLNFINKPSLCAEPGLKSTDQRFSEAVNAHDSLITLKSCLSRNSSCPALWNAAWTQPVGVDGRQSMEQTCSGAVPERTHIPWNPGVSSNWTFIFYEL